MGNGVPYNLQDELERLSKEYTSLLYRFSQGEDADIFVDCYNKLLALKDQVDELPASEDKYEANSQITAFMNAISSLLHY